MGRGRSLLAAARERGVRFYCNGTGWSPKRIGPARETLAAIAALDPDALLLRDPGLCREAGQRHPDLALHAAANCGFHNSPGLRLAQKLGFRRVLLSGPINLKDLALLGGKPPCSWRWCCRRLAPVSPTSASWTNIWSAGPVAPPRAALRLHRRRRVC